MQFAKVNPAMPPPIIAILFFISAKIIKPTHLSGFISGGPHGSYLVLF
tara:strand:+ start:28 stop:171 length:144 start_codon:yes stop_codon:yes gene_type:complete